MLKHDDIWRAIDTLATRNGLTASGLARKAGLDPTTFNKSKRVTAAGRRRWPSTESLAKALDAVGTSLNEFVGYVEGAMPPGAPVTQKQLPEVDDPDAYAIVIERDDYRPVLRKGARVVAAPHAPRRPGDRIVVRLSSSELILAELVREEPGKLEIRPLTGGEARVVDRGQIAALHRIVWAEQ